MVDAELFHVGRTVAWNTHPPLVVGSKLAVGTQRNPFFGFCGRPRTEPVNTETGVVHVGSVKFLKEVRSGTVNAPELARIADETVAHLLMLVRELVFGEVRLKTAADVPSRQTCLWMVETLEAAKSWKVRFDNIGDVVRLRASGKVAKVDAGWLPGELYELSRIYSAAKSYREGSAATNSEPELLFSGDLEVLEVLQ
ncbi:MAG: DUF2441 domain-containing protein [Devosia sp.]|nr:DUF2441 domain-containing protein [Devosia sp.]